MRQDLRSNGLDINFESRAAINTALAYICFCSNLHGSHSDTKSSPKSLALGEGHQESDRLIWFSCTCRSSPKALKAGWYLDLNVQSIFALTSTLWETFVALE